MKTILCLIAALLLPAICVRGDEVKVPLISNGADVKDFLPLYERWTGRKVWVTLDLRAELYFKANGPLSKSEAILFLRTTLLEQYGIEIRDIGDKEAFVTWSGDPKYREIVEAMKKNPELKRPAGNTGRQRVRVVDQ